MGYSKALLDAGALVSRKRKALLLNNRLTLRSTTCVPGTLLKKTFRGLNYMTKVLHQV